MDRKEPMVELTEPLERALVFATQKHAGDVRKGTRIPYISHLLQVAGLVLEYGGDEAQAVAGLLHDVVEDQKATLAEVREQFGNAVARIVEGCSDSTRQSGEKDPWLDRKQAYLRKLAGEPADTRLVSAADKLHNARALLSDYRELGDSLFARFNADKAATLWYYHALIDVYRATRTNPWLVSELSRTVAELARLAYSDKIRPGQVSSALDPDE